MSAVSNRPAKAVSLRSVAVPTEHGGWSLTLEPVVLGLVVAWSWPGLALGGAALGAFLIRSPLKLVLVDLWRRRWLPRTAMAAKVVAVELTVLAALLALVTDSSGFSFWVPITFAVPLVALEMWYDMRSRSRRLLPELAGAIGIGASAAAIAIVGAESGTVAAGLWSALAVRSVAAIPYVRHQVLRTKAAPTSRRHSDAAQVIAVAGALVSAALGLVPVAVPAVITLLALLNVAAVRLPPRRVAVLGIEQVLSGVAVVATTAVAVSLI